MNRDEAHRRISACQPAWVAVERVRDVAASSEPTLHHAGPPYARPDHIPAPVMNSMAVAAVFEGWAETFPEARRLIETGAILTAAAQDHRLLVPLAGVLSPSMAVITVADLNTPGSRLHCALNEGNVHATRLGKADAALPDHLRWLNGAFAEWLAQAVTEPVALAPVIRAARAEGDECHARTLAGTRLLAELVISRTGAGDGTTAAMQDFLAASGGFALSFWMAAAGLCLRAAEGVPEASYVSRAGGNGRDFGIQLARAPDAWIRMAAPVPRGTVEQAAAGAQTIGGLGDSAVVDLFGLGGQSLAGAPTLAAAYAAHLPQDAFERPSACLGPGRQDMGLAHCATDAARCAATGKGPLILIGMIDAEGRAGRIGGGVIDMGAELFREALA